ncbi:hypothetical protein [Burkholderia gladioli]|uniref:hypothetical protein n=1 Tax=Burkholderia gladioli TaxID=28095 RepID=UPI001CC36EF5|nr:hypothetical protein [Burkholderia gladioli]
MDIKKATKTKDRNNIAAFFDMETPFFDIALNQAMPANIDAPPKNTGYAMIANISNPCAP